MSQRTPLPAVPIRTPLTNSDGTLNQTWMKFFQKNAAAGTSTGTGGSGAGAAIATITAVDNPGARTIDPRTRQQSTEIDTTVTTVGGVYPEDVTFWKSTDNGATFVGIGWFNITAPSDVFQCTGIVPELTQHWKMAACAGAITTNPAVHVPAASLPAGSLVSSSITVAGVSLPDAGDIAALTVSAGSGGGNPYDAIRPDGSHYWAIDSVSYDDSGAVADQAAFFVRLTVQACDSSHATIGPEVPYAGTYPGVAGGTQTFGPLLGDYGNQGNGVTYTGNIAYVRFRVYVCNRVDASTYSFQNAACATLQSGIGGGLGYLDVLVATGLTLPAATDIATLTIPTGGSGSPSFPYNAIRPDGTQYWSIPTVAYDDTGAIPDVNCFFVRITVQAVGASHTTIGPEVPFGGTFPANTGAVQTFGPLMGDYGNSGNGTTYTGNLAYVRFRVYGINQGDSSTNSYTNSAAATLQTGIGGGAGYVDILVASAGLIPSGKLKASRLDPLTYDSSIFGIDLAGQFAQLAVDLSLPKAGTFDANVFKSVGNVFKLNYDTTNFDSAGGSLVIKQIDAGSIKTGNLLVGTSVSGIAASVTVYKNVAGVNTVVGWIGSNGAVVGGWVKEFYIGGTSPANAQIYCNSAGSAVFSGSIVVGQISGLGVLATQNSVTTGQVSGLGALATQNIVFTSQVSGLGTLATQNIVYTSQVSGLGPFATATVISGNSITTGTINCNLVNITGTLTAALLSLNLNNITTTITNAYDPNVGDYVGVKIASNFYATQSRMRAGELYLHWSNNSQLTLNALNGLFCTDTNGSSSITLFSQTGRITATAYDTWGSNSGYNVAGAQVITPNRDWAGSGYVLINTPRFGGCLTNADHINAGTYGSSTGVFYIYDSAGNYKGKTPYYI